MIKTGSVRISVKTSIAWYDKVPDKIEKAKAIYPDLKPIEIGEEKFTPKTKGRGEISLKIRGYKIKMAVPAGEWEYIKKK